MTTETPNLDELDWWLSRTTAMRDALASIQKELNRLISATGASAQDPLERIADLHRRIHALHATAWDALSVDDHQVHDWMHRDPGAPWAPGNIGVSRPVGLDEIAQLLGVKRDTVDHWRHRKILPDPTWTVSGRPLWRWLIIEQWARETGRLPANGS